MRRAHVLSSLQGAEQGLPEIDVLLKGMLSQPGVEGFMVFNDEGEFGVLRRSAMLESESDNASVLAGIPVKWTNSGFVKPGAILGANPIPAPIVHHAALIGDLAAKAKASTKRLLGDEGDLSLIRLHTKFNELVVAPSEETTLVIVQKAHQGTQQSIVEIAEAAHAQALADVSRHLSLCSPSLSTGSHSLSPSRHCNTYAGKREEEVMRI